MWKGKQYCLPTLTFTQLLSSSFLVNEVEVAKLFSLYFLSSVNNFEPEYRKKEIGLVISTALTLGNFLIHEPCVLQQEKKMNIAESSSPFWECFPPAWHEVNDTMPELSTSAWDSPFILAIEKGIRRNLDPHGMEEFKYIYMYIIFNRIFVHIQSYRPQLSTHLLILYIFGAKFWPQIKNEYFVEDCLFFEKNWSHFDRVCSFGEFDGSCPRFGPAASGGFQVWLSWCNNWLSQWSIIWNLHMITYGSTGYWIVYYSKLSLCQVMDVILN